MSIRKRNEFLDDDDASENERENGSASEAEEGRAGIANKRRKLDTEEESWDGTSDDEEEVVKTTKSATRDPRFDLSTFGREEGSEEEEGGEDDNGDHAERTSNHKDSTTPTPRDRSATKKSHERKAYEQAHRKVQKSGVVYISRVPPFMKPMTLKHYLEPHAPHGLGRIFLTPEDPHAHTKRVKNGGNKKKSFTDGWVEFHSKREARAAADLLNGNIIGGKKGGFYHDDLWNMKYLRGFKWEHLTEQIANENAERAARIREEIRRTRKENKAFVEDVERGKMLEGMERKKRAKAEREGGNGDGSGKDGQRAKAIGEKVDRTLPMQRKFTQKKVKDRDERERGEKPFAAVEGVRSKIF